MRKLLVASQKGGVGKTTTSINLAASTAMAGARVLLLDADPLSSISASLNLTENPQRQPLREAGIDLPGVLVCNVIPGLDVLSPYDNGGCSDEDLDQLLALVATPAFQECYGCLIVDTPPFMGANPAQLLATCDEFVLVMRAEPMAYRTLPAFLELMQRSKGNLPVKMRGILLTLPDGEQAGGRWERELRGRFGSRILPHVVPYDEAVSQSLLFGQIVSHANREASVSLAYHGLVEHLQLAADARETIERTSAASALLLASASLKTSMTARKPVEKPTYKRPSKTVKTITAPTMDDHVPPTRPVDPVPPMQSPTHDVDLPEPIQRRLTPIVPVPAVSRPESDHYDAHDPHEEAPRPVVPTAPRRAAPMNPPVNHGGGGSQMVFGLLWILAAVVVGIGLKFVPEQFMLPVVVGVVVAGVVILALRQFMMQQEEAPSRPIKPPTPSRLPRAGSLDGGSASRRGGSGSKRPAGSDVRQN